MELLLNLFWLTLAVPALWMWCRKAVYAKDRGRFDGIRPLLLLGCALMLLFPVVSATDDLHAMRQEMEESSPSNRIVKQATGDKSVVGLNIPRALPAWIFPVPFGPDCQACRQVFAVSALLPQQAHSTERASRAPPFASPGEGIGFAV
jgi:hypothetical protein